MGMAAGGSWADMKTSVQFSCPLPREKWLQQVIPLFRLVTQRNDMLSLGCRKACKIKKPVSNALQMALAAWHEWMSGFPWETKCVCTVHLLSLIPKYSWKKREDFSTISMHGSRAPQSHKLGQVLMAHQVCWPWSAWSMLSSTCPWTHLYQSGPQNPQGLQCTAWARGGHPTLCREPVHLCTHCYTHGCPHDALLLLAVYYC